MDIKNAFLHGEIDETVYTKTPTSYIGSGIPIFAHEPDNNPQTFKVCKLKKPCMASNKHQESGSPNFFLPSNHLATPDPKMITLSSTTTQLIHIYCCLSMLMTLFLLVVIHSSSKKASNFSLLGFI